MPERPDTLAALVAWLANHRNEVGYAVLAFVMSILTTSRNKTATLRDRITGALMCAIFCYFAQPTLTAICSVFGLTFSPELTWPFSAAVGYIGVDSLFASLRKRVGLDSGRSDNANS